MTESRVVVLTGGAGILGSVIARRLYDDGYSVAIVDRAQDRVDEVRAQLGSPERTGGYVLDVTDRSAVQDLSHQVATDLGEVDVLVNAAAGKSENFFEPFEDFPVEDWREVMDGNVLSAVTCAQVFGAGMAQRGSGTIINFLSIYGIAAPDQRIYEGSEYLGRAINTPAVYSASKAALWGLTMYLASYWGDQGVRTNAITPGGVFSGQNDTFVERYSDRVPMHRMAQPEEIAAGVAFLASPEASYVNGHNLVIDGGLTAW